MLVHCVVSNKDHPWEHYFTGTMEVGQINAAIAILREQSNSQLYHVYAKLVASSQVLFKTCGS